MIGGLLLGMALHTVVYSPQGNGWMVIANASAKAESLPQRIADTPVPITRISFAGAGGDRAGAVAEPLPVAAQAQTYELHFWPGATAEQDSRFVQISPPPCGTVAVARVTAMPDLEDGSLEPERVVEFSLEGELLRQWAIPVDSYPVGIQGDRLLINFYGSPPLWISLNGSITVEDNEISLPPTEQIECDFSAEAFPNSAYAGCTRFQDINSGESRLLSFEGVCT